MGRRGIAVLFIVSLFVVGLGSFYLGRSYLFYAMMGGNLGIADQIADEAKKRVKQPTLPPKPGGKTVTSYKTVEKQVWTRVLDENGSHRELAIVSAKVPVTKLVDASANEIELWNAEVKKLQDDYNAKLSVEIERVAEEKQLMAARDWFAYAKALITEGIIPFLTALGGLIGAIVALRKAFGAGSDQTKAASSSAG